MFEKTVHHLPIEIWDRIARDLTVPDRLRLSECSQFLNSAVSNPSLWADVSLNKKKVKEQGIMAIFNTKFRKFKKLNLSFCKQGDYTALFEYMASEVLLHIEEIEGGMKWSENQTAVQNVDPRVMGKALARLKKVSLDEVFLTTQQWREFFQEISRSSQTSVEDLDLSCAVGTIRSVPAATMGKALAKVKKVNLQGNILDQDQMEWTMHEMSQQSNVEDIDLSHSDIKKLPPNLVGKALQNVQVLRLAETQATEEQWKSIFRCRRTRAEIEGTYRLGEEVDLRGTRLTHVDPDLVAEGVTSFTKAYLSRAWMTPDTWNQVLSSIHSSNTTPLQHVDLSNTDFDENGEGPLEYIREIPGDLLGKAVAKIQKVEAEGTQLADDQYIGLLKALSDRKNCKLTDLSLSGDLRRVPPEFCKYLANLSRVDLGGSKLSKDQWVCFLTEMLATPPGNIQDVVLDFSNWEEADTQLLNQVEEHLGIMMY